GRELADPAQVGRPGERVDELPVAVPHLDEPELRDVTRHGRLHCVDPFAPQRVGELRLRRQVPVGHELQDLSLTLGLAHPASTSWSSEIPCCASSRVIVSGGVMRSAVSPAVPTSTPFSSAAYATGPAGRCSSTASRSPAPRTSGSASANSAPTSRTCASNSS